MSLPRVACAAEYDAGGKFDAFDRMTFALGSNFSATGSPVLAPVERCAPIGVRTFVAAAPAQPATTTAITITRVTRIHDLRFEVRRDNNTSRNSRVESPRNR